MQKIAIISDIHGNIVALEKVVEDIQTRHVDCVFNLGDHASGPLWPKETIQFLMTQDWVHILGNHDRQLVEQSHKDHGLSDYYAFEQLGSVELDWLRILPGSIEIQSTFSTFLLLHGTPSSDTVYLLETIKDGIATLATPTEIQARLDRTKSNIVLCGHSHIPRLVSISKRLIINPGSIGLPAFDDEFPEYHVMETGSHHARYSILEYKKDNWIPEMIAVSYDHQKAANQAHRNGRPDWEMGIRTGFMDGHQDRIMAGNLDSPEEA